MVELVDLKTVMEAALERRSPLAELAHLARVIAQYFLLLSVVMGLLLLQKNVILN